MEHLFNKLKQVVEVQESKTHDTQSVWVGNDIDFVNLLMGGVGRLFPIEDRMYLILGDDDFILLNKGELTEDLANKIIMELL